MRELSEKQMAFAVWHATAPVEREIETEADLMEVLGLSRQTAWRWRQDPRVLEAIRYLSLQKAGSPERTAKLLDMVYDKAIADRDIRAADLWCKAAGVTTQFQRSSSLLEAVEAEAGEFTNFSLDELKALRATLAAGEAESIAVANAKAKLGKADTKVGTDAVEA